MEKIQGEHFKQGGKGLAKTKAEIYTHMWLEEPAAEEHTEVQKGREMRGLGPRGGG